MKLSAVLLARIIYFVESSDLNPRGVAYYPDIIKALVERYTFQGYPQKLEDFDEEKGVTFSMGRFSDKTIEKVVIYNWGLTLDTTSSTDDAEALLDEALRWISENLGLTYDSRMIKRKSYVSQITFYSEAPLLSLNPILDRLSARLTEVVSQNLKLQYSYQPTGILLNADPETVRLPVQMFSIERRQGTTFSEGKYFSAAPVPTDVHVDMIIELERYMTKNQPSVQAVPLKRDT